MESTPAHSAQDGAPDGGGAECAAAVHAARRSPLRPGRVGDPRRADRPRRPRAFEQKDVEFPKSWSQNATNIVAQKYFRGQLDSPTRERSVKQMVSRVAGTIADWGRERGYFATVEDGDTFEAELTLHPAQPARGVQLAGLVQRRLRGAAAVLGLLHPQRRGHDGVDPGLEHQGGQDLPRRFRLGHQPLQHPRVDGAAGQGRHRLRSGLLHARGRRLGGHDQVRRQDAPRGQDGRARRRPPGHPRVHLVQGQGGGQGRRAARRRVRHVDRRRRLPLDPVPERQQLGPRHRRVHARGRERRGLAPDSRARRASRSASRSPRAS